MRWSWVAFVVGLAALMSGCASVPAPVPVEGQASDIARLAGEWSGEYQGETNGRNGSIVFQLAAGADTARGDVVMIAHQRKESHMPQQDPSIGLPVARSPAVISIAFVRATDGGLHGQLSPYRDPDCDCTLNTRFQGRIQGDVIQGTYVSQPVDGGLTQSGTWKVKRKKD